VNWDLYSKLRDVFANTSSKNGTDSLRLYYEATDIIRLVDETQETKKKVERDVTILEAGIGDSSNPRSDDDV
jgi:hypothetical protein